MSKVSGVFGDWAARYFDLGINVIPITVDKRPPKGFLFKQWLDKKQTEEEIELMISQYGQCTGIAIVCGEVSGISAFDYDYKFNANKMRGMDEKKWKKDNAIIDGEIRQNLNAWHLVKKAKDGWTCFVKWSPNHRTVAADRNGVRLFDFKATGYVVIPPSLHSTIENVNLHYKWIAGDPMSDFSDLPLVDFEIIKEMALRFGEKKQSLLNNRHGRVFIYGVNLSKVEKDPEKLGSAMIEYDLRCHHDDPKGPYFNDRKHTGNDPHSYAHKWAERILSYKKLTGDSEPSPESEQDVYDYFFLKKFKYGAPKKDILSRKVFYKHPSDNCWASGEEVLASLKSHGSAAGLKASKIEYEFDRFQIELKQSDFLVDIPQHDGIDHLRRHCDALKVDGFSSDEVYEIFLNWGYLLFARIYDADVQNRCIILKGNQGIGKDRWIKEMVSEFRPYYQPLDIARDPIEMTSAVQKLFVAHISEFDQTKKLDMAFIKALITNPSSFIREKYARVATEKSMRASWISSVNIDDMLRDPTGNRRFIVLPVESITWGYPKVGIKIIAQFKDAYERGIGQTVSDSTEKKIKNLIDRLTPDDMSEDIEDVFKDRLHNIIRNQRNSGDVALGRIKSNDAADMIKEVARLFEVSVRRVYRIAKKYKLKTKDSRYYSIMLK